MNTSLTAYTHLESLLLFQSLSVYGLANNAFSKISELLKNNPSIASDRRFQSGRLSPDALRNFCLHLLKEEERSEQRQDDRVDGEVQNGEVRNARKRKAPSPSFPTVQEATQHAHLIPKLVNKLYARYRTALTNEIRDDEERYERLQRELQSIERGERDGELLERVNGKPHVPPGPSQTQKSPLLQQKPARPVPSPQFPVQGHVPIPTPVAGAPLVPPAPPSSVEAQKTPTQLNGSAHVEPAKQPSVANHRQDYYPPVSQPHPLPTPSPLARPGQPPPPQPPSIKPPYNAAPYLKPSPYHTQPPQQPAVAPHAAPPGGIPTPASPLELQRGLSPSHAGQNVQRFPPVAGAPQGDAVSQQPPQGYVGSGGPRPGPFPGQYPQPGQQYQVPYAPASQPPGPQPPQQQRNLPYSGAPAYAPQPHPSQPSPQGGYMLPPFQITPQSPSRAQPPASYPQVSTPGTRPHQPVISTASSTPTVGRPSLPHLQPPNYRPVSAFSTPQSIRTPQSGVSTPRSAASRWKQPPKALATPPVSRPRWESLDDVTPQAPASAKGAEAKAKPPKKTKPKGKAKEKEPEEEKEAQAEVATQEQAEEHVSEMETRQGRSRRTGTSRRARPPSLASSKAGGSVRGRSRSHSIISHTETIAAENESQTSARVKDERRPSIDVHMDDDTMGAPSQPVTRRRGAAAQTKGRKRTAREASIDESEEHVEESSPTAARVVIAPRNFSRMANPIMNDIASHKHASTFNTAVKAKNAEGYYDIIKRPTDLKSIRQAVTAGAKVVAAAASSISDTPNANGGSTPSGSSGGFVELPLGEDSVPPRVIVNSAQLEHELMRMFANAVMFNPGEEGVVEDAREMFESCQEAVSNWRSSAERSMMVPTGSGNAGVGDETPALPQTPAEEKEKEDGPTASKRRKA